MGLLLLSRPLLAGPRIYGDNPGLKVMSQNNRGTANHMSRGNEARCRVVGPGFQWACITYGLL